MPTTVKKLFPCLNIPKGYSESVNRRRTDNTMAKRKNKGTNNDLQNIYIEN
jgi:hypothetical protein